MSIFKLEKAKRNFINILTVENEVDLYFKDEYFCKIKKWISSNVYEENIIYFDEIIEGEDFPVELYFHGSIVCGIDFNLMYPAFKHSFLCLDFLLRSQIPFFILDYFTCSNKKINISEKNIRF